MPYYEIRRMIVEVDEDQLTEPMIQVQQDLHKAVKNESSQLPDIIASALLHWTQDCVWDEKNKKNWAEKEILVIMSR